MFFLVTRILGREDLPNKITPRLGFRPLSSIKTIPVYDE